MNPNVLFAAAPAAFFTYCFVKWKRSRTSLAGNELLLLPLLLVFALVVPAPLSVCIMRLSLSAILFGLYLFWNSIQRRGRKTAVPLFAWPAVAMAFYEVAASIYGVQEAGFLDGYLFIAPVLWGVFCVYIRWERKAGCELKGSVGVDVLLEQIAVTAPFVGLGSSAVAVLHTCRLNPFAGYAFVAVFILLFLWYMHTHKPDCMDSGPFVDVNPCRKRGYAAGRLCREGAMLEDEGNVAVNEAIVEDSRIIYALISLFEKEKLYMNVDIKIANVALMIGTNKTYLSRALNTRLSRNFCQFVNYYRVKEVCTLFLENPGAEMKELAEQCGFNSSSNFSIVFKYNTGFTPGDWSRMVKMKLENNENVSVDDYLR